MLDMSPVVLADVAHEWRPLALVLETRELDQVHRMTDALRILLRLLRKRHALVLRKRACGMRGRRALDT